jgi:ketosteroid isomerase-like protein
VNGSSLEGAIADQDLELVGEMVDAWNRGDLSEWIQAFDDDVVWFALPGNVSMSAAISFRERRIAEIRFFPERADALEAAQSPD